ANPQAYEPDDWSESDPDAEENYSNNYSDRDVAPPTASDYVAVNTANTIEDDDDDTPAWEDPSWQEEVETSANQAAAEATDKDPQDDIPIVESATQARVREIQRHPVAEQHSGSSYSYTFRPASQTEAPDSHSESDVNPNPQESRNTVPNAGPPGAVYDADFRVLTPNPNSVTDRASTAAEQTGDRPARSTKQATSQPKQSADDDWDWDESDDQW
ncbi:MAG: hypothetical protein AAGF24_09520, partial [Cyanobacteria bacterium P01_H01_bin.121]